MWKNGTILSCHRIGRCTNLGHNYTAYTTKVLLVVDWKTLAKITYKFYKIFICLQPFLGSSCQSLSTLTKDVFTKDRLQVRVMSEDV